MEYKVIGSLLTDNKFIKYYYGKLTPEMFEIPVCREAYTQCIRLYDSGKPINITELKKSLEGSYDNETIAMFFKRCIDNSIYADSEARSLQSAIFDRYRAVELKSLCNSLTYLPKNVNEEIIAINKATENLIKGSELKGHSLEQITNKYKDYYGKEHPPGIKTGIYALDELLVSLEKGDMTVIGARPAVGKSALATQIIMSNAEKGYRVGYFNLEMTEKQIFERIVARYSKIGLLRLRKALQFIGDEQKKYNEAIERIKNYKNLIIYSGSFTTNDIKMHCKNQDFDLVVIDYLQLVKANKSYNNRVSEVGDVSKGIKALAMELKTPVIALSQLNRTKNATDEPTISDLRESGDIEQDASNVMLMWNIDEAGTVKGLKIEKNRQSVLGKVALSFEGSEMEFKAITHKPFEVVEREYKGFKKMSSDNPFD